MKFENISARCSKDWLIVDMHRYSQRDTVTVLHALRAHKSRGRFNYSGFNNSGFNNVEYDQGVRVRFELPEDALYFKLKFG